MFYLKGKTTLIGKRVPGVEINVQIVQAIKIDKLDFHRVCLQSGKTTISGLPFVSLVRTYLVKELIFI